MTKTYQVLCGYGRGGHKVRANWFRIRMFSSDAVFYCGLRKVGYIEGVTSVTEVQDEV